MSITSIYGNKFSSVGIVNNSIKDDDLNVLLKDYSLNLSKTIKTRFIKIKAKNYGNLPYWHAGAGGDAYIFIDEIIVN